ncbi:MAG: sugar phosphate isomerase/epimerase [Peptococcaceae bacterium]|jgi:sugar phosphate isomerase/epimerase|nr:sugar phosphate isomerase/epimerase [Peptococcaceae bacterium]
MKLGFVSSILGHLGFDDVVATAGKLGYGCVELACWPAAGAERRYAGVSHLDVDRLDAEHVRAVCERHSVEISSLGFYPNILSPDPGKREAAAEHLRKLIVAGKDLGVGMVTTFIGRDQTLDVEENFALFKAVWPPLIAFAEENGVRVAIENCPMLFTRDEWPGGQNLASAPAVWRRMFEAIPSPYFGLNYDPSHFVWQMIDYIKPLYEFKDRIFHVHCKDVKLFRDKLADVGVMAYPLEFMAPKLPGLGDVDWGAYASALSDIGYDGHVCVEMEDRAFEQNAETIESGLALSKRYLSQFFA